MDSEDHEFNAIQELIQTALPGDWRVEGAFGSSGMFFDLVTPSGQTLFLDFDQEGTGTLPTISGRFVLSYSDPEFQDLLRFYVANHRDMYV